MRANSIGLHFDISNLMGVKMYRKSVKSIFCILLITDPMASHYSESKQEKALDLINLYWGEMFLELN